MRSHLSSRSSVIVGALLACSTLLWATPAQAQHRRVVRSHVFVSAGFGYGPFFGPWYPYPYPYLSPYQFYGFYQPESDVRLLVTPKQTKVYVDGYYVGLVDSFDGVFQRLHVAPGRHDLVLYLEGYKSIHEKMDLASEATYTLHYVLEPLATGDAQEPPPVPSAPPPESARSPQLRRPGPYGPPPMRGRATSPAEGFGTLAIRVQPGDAEVSIDGEPWQGPEGADRLQVQVAEGRHLVEIRKDGFTPYANDVDVRGGETTTLNVSLPPARQ